MDRVHHCIRESSVLGSELERRTAAWDVSEGKDSRVS